MMAEFSSKDFILTGDQGGHHCEPRLTLSSTSVYLLKCYLLANILLGC